MKRQAEQDIHRKTREVSVASVHLDDEAMYSLLKQILRHLPFVMNTNQQALIR